MASRLSKRPNRFDMLVIAGGILIAMPSSGVADGYFFPIEAGKSGAQAELHETRYMRLGPKAATWVPRFVEVLRRNRPPRSTLGTIALLTGERNRSYLAVVWLGQTIQTPLLEFHRLIEADDGRLRLKYLRGIHAASVDLEAPSSKALFAGEPTVAVVDMWDGGLGVWNFRLRLIQMKRNTVDITPDWAGLVVDVVDFDKDGQYEVATMDGRWTGFFSGAAAAGPHLPVVLARVDKKFIPACRAHAVAYRAWIQNAADYARDPKNRVLWRIDAHAHALLAQAQIGRFANARKSFAAMKALYAGAGTEHGGPDKRVVLDHFSDVLAQSERNGSFPCPVSATESKGGHHGLIDRINSFRVPRP